MRPCRGQNPSYHDCMADHSTPAERYICIHGHFYQPPRENPWLETVETEDSAAPYHDWNERITAECYAPNGASRIVNGENQIIRIMNNYSRISFNFGPTLLSWLEENAPRTYRMIRDADRQSMLRYGRPWIGTGPGLQPRHHAPGQHARPHHPDPLGHRRLSASLRPRRPKACGFRKPRSITRLWTCWRNMASSSPSLRPTSAPGCASAPRPPCSPLSPDSMAPALAGSRRPMPRSIPTIPTWCS